MGKTFLMAWPDVTEEMWHEAKEMIKKEFDSADTDGDGMLSEDEFTAATQPGAACMRHDDCDEFCYEGQCAPCDECHYCWDGIDGTCGTCGDGFPTKDDKKCGVSGELSGPLMEGEYIQSLNGQYSAVCQADGNFVLYSTPWSLENALWDTHTHNIGIPPYKCYMQGDN